MWVPVIVKSSLSSMKKDYRALGEQYLLTLEHIGSFFINIPSQTEGV